MSEYSLLCTHCNARLQIRNTHNNTFTCPVCNSENPLQVDDFKKEEIDFYPIQEPYVYISIVKDIETVSKKYIVLEPFLKEDEQKALMFIQKELMNRFTIRLDELNSDAEQFLYNHYKQVIKEYDINLDDLLEKKIMYYLKRFFLGYDIINALMHDPYIEDISCDGSSTPIFIHHRNYGSLETSIIFQSEDELSKFVVKLSQKCGKHISVSTPMLDATMPDGSRIQMTLSSEITTKGSTFTIRRFRKDPITPIDLINFKTVSAEVLAYLWITVEHGYNALVAGGTASGKTSLLNSMSLFIPREAKIVSIEETREINLPHPNWIPGVARSGFGEVMNNHHIGEIDLFDLMKAALRQRPEYILVGEIRGKEAYVLFQAMATGHTTYSTVHADSMKSLIHRLEGKPINVPRNMMQSLDIVLLQSIVKMKDKSVRRCKEIVEVITVDAETHEFLTNSVFKWDPVEDKFIYSGKSFILEKIRDQIDVSKNDMVKEISQREQILQWMNKHNIRDFIEVSNIISTYKETPNEMMKKIQHPPSRSVGVNIGEGAVEEAVPFAQSLLDISFDIDLDNNMISDEDDEQSGGFLARFLKKNKAVK